MSRFLGVLMFILIIDSGAKAQNQQKLHVGVSSGLASGWWIYTLGTGAGIDRTDNEPKVSFELEAVYKPTRLGFGLGVGYSFLTDNSMEAFEDTRAQRRKYLIAENSVKFWLFYLLGEYDLYSSNRYTLSPQIKAGSFSIDTIHPEKDNFDQKFFFELSALNTIGLTDDLGLTIRPFYQVMMIAVKEETIPGEKHRIFSFGLSLGMRYCF